MSGALSHEDWDIPYHNSANLTFSPYIVDPETTCNQTSRSLQKRFLKIHSTSEMDNQLDNQTI